MAVSEDGGAQLVSLSTETAKRSSRHHPQVIHSTASQRLSCGLWHSMMNLYPLQQSLLVSRTWRSDVTEAFFPLQMSHCRQIACCIFFFFYFWVCSKMEVLLDSKLSDSHLCEISLSDFPVSGRKRRRDLRFDNHILFTEEKNFGPFYPFLEQ